MNAPNVKAAPHAPTLVYALVAVVAVIALYHLCLGRKRR